VENTPTYEFLDGTIYDENRKEFNRIIKKYPNSAVAKKAKELISLLDAKVPEEEVVRKINIRREY
jgi:outer membrane protein assembly factor BamD (BamD/ComL family)